MARRVILLDYENIRDSILDDVKEIRKQDITYLFKPIHKNKDTCLSRIESKFKEKGLNLRIIPIYTNGKNALDFQLASLLGNLIKTGPKSSYLIISKDQGYLPLHYFWGSQNINVICGESLRNAINSDEVTREFISLKGMELAEFINKVSHNFNVLNSINELNSNSRLAKYWLAEEIYMYKDSEVFMQYVISDILQDNTNLTWLTIEYIRIIVNRWYNFLHCTITEETEEEIEDETEENGGIIFKPGL